MNVFVIGSVSTKQSEKQIQKIAEYYRSLGHSVKAVSRQPNKSFEVLIKEAFKNIELSDLVVIAVKSDGSIGNGTTYEKVFADYLHKDVVFAAESVCPASPPKKA